MKAYRVNIELITNLQVGNGEANFGVIDNLIQRDVATGFPCVNASSLKGALREHCNKYLNPRSVVEVLFGSGPNSSSQSAGILKFLDASLVSMPIRCGKKPYIMPEYAYLLDRYRALVCAIETGSLSAAAEALQYTPSGVSRMVAALEEETGVPLLLREHSGVRPTKECEKLLPAIRDLLHAGESCALRAAARAGCRHGYRRNGIQRVLFAARAHHIGFPRALRRHSGAAARWVQHRADHTAQRAPTRSVLHLLARGWARLAPHRLR